MKRTVRGLLAGAALLASAGIALAAGSGNGVLNVSVNLNPISINPAKAAVGRLGTYLYPAYASLVETQADGTMKPGLATEWKLSDGNKKITFTLRQDAKFSDGEPVNADAAVKSINYWRGAGGPFSSLLSDVASVDKIGDYTFSVTVNNPNPDLATLFDAYHMAGDLISPKGVDNPDKLGTETLGAGPYMLDPSATVTNNTYTYVPNANYYDPSRIHWDGIVVKVISDPNAGVQALKTGQTDFLIADAITAKNYAATLGDGFHILHEREQWTGLVLMDRAGEVNPAMKDIRVRQALNYAMDRPAITKALFGDYGAPTGQLMGDGFVGYDPAFEQRYPYDPEKAKQLLAEAGYGSGLTITNILIGNPLNSSLTEVIAGQLRKVGVTLESTEMQGAAQMAPAMASKKYSASVFQIYYDKPFVAQAQLIQPSSVYNRLKYVDPAVNDLVSAAAVAAPEQQVEAWHRVYQYLIDEAWFLPVSAIDNVYLVSDKIEAPKIGQSIMIDLKNVQPNK